MSRLVALIGRPNVGKSTLFNRLTASREAIMDVEEGITRDRHYGEVEWIGERFTLIDTGGYLDQDIDQWTALIREQIHHALQEAQLLLFLLDTSTGLLATDYALAKELRKLSKPLLLVANKSDNHKLLLAAEGFHELGIGLGLFPICALNGSGTGELLDAVVEQLPQAKALVASEAPRVALLGRPNVGKSTLLNTWLNAPRSIVSDTAGTTRDAIEAPYKAFNKNLILIDTAGLRRRAKVKESVEFYATLRALSAMERADVCALLIDATQHSLSSQDLHLLSLAHRRHKGLLLVVNKWDLIQKDSSTQRVWIKRLAQQLGNLSYIPIVFVSAIQKQRIFNILEKVERIATLRASHLSTSALNQTLLPLIENTPPPVRKGRRISIKYITQIQRPYPHFLFFANFPQYIEPNYARFVEKMLRTHFDFYGVPLELSFRKK